MRLPALIALIPLTACSTVTTKKHPYAEANALMRQEIQSRIANIQYQHNQELLNNLLWLEGKAGELAIPDLLEALHHREPKVRSSAVWVLGRIRDRRVIPRLQPLTSDTNEAVRMEAARSLVTMGDLKFSPILIEGLDSDKVPVRYNCHMALRDSTNRDFEYDHLEDDIHVRRQAVLRWRQWWAKQSGDPWYAANYAKQFKLQGKAGAKAGVPSVPMTETKGSTSTPDQSDPQPAQPQPKAEPAQPQPKAEPAQPQPKAEPAPPQGQPKAGQPKPPVQQVENPKSGTPPTGTPPVTGEKQGRPPVVVDLPRGKGEQKKN